jgi:hypothetical protein
MAEKGVKRGKRRKILKCIAFKRRIEVMVVVEIVAMTIIMHQMNQSYVPMNKTQQIMQTHIY